MNVDVYYIHPTVEADLYGKLAKTFRASFNRHDPGFSNADLHELPTDGTKGKDIGAYIRAAKYCKADLMICLGSHVRINSDGWLSTIVNKWEEHGEGLYGPFGTNEPTSHLRTTAFWTTPSLLANYPWTVETDQDRYDFELSPEKSISTYADEMGLTVGQVTKSSVWTFVFEPFVKPEDSLFLDKYTDQQNDSRK